MRWLENLNRGPWQLLELIWIYFRAGSHGVPSPKSQHGGEVPTFEPQETIWIWFVYVQVVSSLYYAEPHGTCWESRSTLNTSSKPHLQKVLPCRYSCHTWDLGLGAPCEVISPNFHALNGWDCTDWPQVTWHLGLGTSCELLIKWLYKSSLIMLITDPKMVIIVWACSSNFL